MIHHVLACVAINYKTGWFIEKLNLPRLGMTNYGSGCVEKKSRNVSMNPTEADRLSSLSDLDTSAPHELTHVTLPNSR
jgi:hypothetical protein